MTPEDRQRDFNLRCHPEQATVYDVNWLIARVDRLTEEVEKWKGIASRINDGLETLKENTDAEVDRLTEENDRLKAQVAAAWDEGEAAGRENADAGYPDPLFQNPYRALASEERS